MRRCNALVALRNARPLDQRPEATLGRTIRDSRRMFVLEMLANASNDDCPG